MNAKFFVPFETAQRLKEKGYPQDKSDYGYFDNGDSHPLIVFPADNFDCAAPTYHEVLDWLEEKGIYVTTLCCLGESDKEDTYKIWWKGFMDIPPHKEQSTLVYHTREESLNACILAALEML